MTYSQISFADEIIVDNFAGGGGASTGIELATGRPVTIAINHDPDAILMHLTNHPYTEHYQASVWDIDPVEVCKGRPVGLAWFSPDCKHFSKAKGKALRDRNIRGLAWIVLRWAGTVRPRIIMLENVEEFQTWCPVRKGKPVKAKTGETFRKWKKQLSDLGYAIEHRELVAADYGAPTSRKRFVLIARCDGEAIVWPERTHAPADSQDVKTGKRKPWIPAASIIDWSLPCPSIFDTKEAIKAKHGLTAVRPLAENTLRRIIRGIDKYTIKSGKPFIVQQKFQNQAQSIDNPLVTITDVGSHELCSPTLIQYHTEQTEAARTSCLDIPLPTVDASNRHALATANLVEYYGNGMPISIDDPMHTITSVDREAIVMAHIAEFKGADKGQHPGDPLRTITAGDGQFGVVKTEIVMYERGKDLRNWHKIRDLLNSHCGYSLGEDEVILIYVNGIAYFIADIGLRMLTPRELYNAMGFPPDYKIDKDYKGNSYGRAKQVARCGNAVCPPMAEAVVRANFISCTEKISTMGQLNDRIAE